MLSIFFWFKKHFLISFVNILLYLLYLESDLTREPILTVWIFSGHLCFYYFFRAVLWTIFKNFKICLRYFRFVLRSCIFLFKKATKFFLFKKPHSSQLFFSKELIFTNRDGNGYCPRLGFCLPSRFPSLSLVLVPHGDSDPLRYQWVSIRNTQKKFKKNF